MQHSQTSIGSWLTQNSMFCLNYLISNKTHFLARTIHRSPQHQSALLNLTVTMCLLEEVGENEGQHLPGQAPKNVPWVLATKCLKR